MQISTSRWRQILMNVQSQLGPETQLQTWRASLHEQKPYVDDFRTFQKASGNTEEPIDWKGLPDFPSVTDANPQASTEERFKAWLKLLREADAALLSPQVALIINSREMVRDSQKGLLEPFWALFTSTSE